MKIGFFLFFLVGPCATALVSAQGAPLDTAQQKVDINMVKMILDGISVNESKMKTFEAEYDIRETLPPLLLSGSSHDDSSDSNTTRDKVRFWKSQDKWRINKESTAANKDKVAKNDVNICFDGSKTVVCEIQTKAGKIYPGNVCFSSDSVWLPYRSYAAFGVDLREHLASANSVQMVHLDGNNYLEIRFSSGRLTACDLTILLEPTKGYCIKKAEIFLPDGTLAGIHESKSINSFDGCWVVLEMFEETYRLSGLKEGKRIISFKEQVTTDSINWNPTIPTEIFSLEFEPNTLVNDLINDKEYLTGYELPFPEPNSIFHKQRLIKILLVNLFVVALFFLWRYLSKRTANR